MICRIHLALLGEGGWEVLGYVCDQWGGVNNLGGGGGLVTWNP